MSTSNRVTCEPIPGRVVEAEYLGEVEHSGADLPMLRVAVDESTYRVPQERVHE